MSKKIKSFKIIIIVLVILIIASYAYYRTIDIIEGPIISIESPKTGESFKKSLIHIKGSVKNASYITMNDRQIFVDEFGKFDERFLLSFGYNILKLKVTDRFNRVEEKKLELVYSPSTNNLYTNQATTTEENTINIATTTNQY